MRQPPSNSRSVSSRNTFVVAKPTLLEEVVALIALRVSEGAEPLAPAECHYLGQICEGLVREPVEVETLTSVTGLLGSFDNDQINEQSVLHIG